MEVRVDSEQVNKEIERLKRITDNKFKKESISERVERLHKELKKVKDRNRHINKTAKKYDIERKIKCFKQFAKLISKSEMKNYKEGFYLRSEENKYFIVAESKMMAWEEYKIIYKEIDQIVFGG